MNNKQLTQLECFELYFDCEDLDCSNYVICERWCREQKRMTKNDLRALVRFTQRVHTEYITTRDMDSFLNIIKDNKIDVVIDIRWSTYHKSKQGFNPKAFKTSLASIGIGYIYFKALGNPFHNLYGPKEFDKAKRDYLNYLKYNSKTVKDFKALYSKFRFKKNYCLVCYCPTEDPLMCHRFWLKEALVNYKRNKLELPENYILKKINNEDKA